MSKTKIVRIVTANETFACKGKTYRKYTAGPSRDIIDHELDAEEADFLLGLKNSIFREVVDGEVQKSEADMKAEAAAAAERASRTVTRKVDRNVMARGDAAPTHQKGKVEEKGDITLEDLKAAEGVEVEAEEDAEEEAVVEEAAGDAKDDAKADTKGTKMTFGKAKADKADGGDTDGAVTV